MFPFYVPPYVCVKKQGFIFRFQILTQLLGSTFDKVDNHVQNIPHFSRFCGLEPVYHAIISIQETFLLGN